MITFKVKSELYGQTDCVINDIDRAIKTGVAPCGDGCDYKLSHNEIKRLSQRDVLFVTDADYKKADKAVIELLRGNGSSNTWAEKQLTEIKDRYGWDDNDRQKLVTELVKKNCPS